LDNQVSAVSSRKTDKSYDLKGGDRTFLACPARFERATYALEEFVAAGISIYFNDLEA
jgi:hypothetical protein